MRWVVILIGLACACSGDDDDDNAQPHPGAGAGAGAACDARTDVFPVVCGTSICHDGAINGLDLIAPGLDERVLDVPAAGTDCGKTTLPLVDSQRPERSLILQKLSEAPPCGSPMPLGSGPSGLTQDQLSCIQAFVRAVAAR
jgi:hypothetical protein